MNPNYSEQKKIQIENNQRHTFTRQFAVFGISIGQLEKRSVSENWRCRRIRTETKFLETSAFFERREHSLRDGLQEGAVGACERSVQKCEFTFFARAFFGEHKTVKTMTNL
jgi:hypothetical protein